MLTGGIEVMVQGKRGHGNRENEVMVQGK